MTDLSRQHPRVLKFEPPLKDTYLLILRALHSYRELKENEVYRSFIVFTKENERPIESLKYSFIMDQEQTKITHNLYCVLESPVFYPHCLYCTQNGETFLFLLYKTNYKKDSAEAVEWKICSSVTRHFSLTQKEN